MTDGEKKEEWVREAIAITDALLGGIGKYLCPLCLKWYEGVADLTLEQAPRRAFAGVMSPSPAAPVTAPRGTPSTRRCATRRRCASSLRGR